MKKSELLNWLKEEYKQWQALLDQIGAPRIAQSGVSDCRITASATGVQNCRRASYVDD